MQIFSPLVAFAGLAAGALADGACSGPNARTDPPAGAIVVDATGAYKNTRLDPNTTSEQTVFVRPGVYNEQVLISPLSGPLVLQGFTCDAMSYASNEVTITQAKAQKDIPAEVTGEARNDMTSTVRFKSDNVKVYNLNIANTAGNVGQALAVNVNATDYGFYACNLTGYQDTVLADKGRELYARTYINGATDFIFGRYAQAWFESCDIETIGTGFITASGRESESSSATGVNSTSLGRPWRPYAKVIWQNSELGDVSSRRAGRLGTPPPARIRLSSRSSTTLARRQHCQPCALQRTADAPVAITEVFGEGYETEWWVDSAYL
ncbi:Pectinesterase, Asp active site [Phytophthora cactorum]|nr:Pectinesterase, Asp active site [Phytophthora cactorum]